MAHQDSLAQLNALLQRIKIPIQIQDLQECVPSLWVALYEGLFECRIPEIDRSFQDVTSPGSRLRNVELVLRELETSVLRMDLSHIKSYALVNRDDRTIRNLIDIFHEIAKSMDAEAEGSLNSNERKDLEEILSTVKEAPTDPTTSGSHESSSYEVLNSNLEPGSILESSSIANITTESRISSAGIPDMSQISPTTRKRKRKLYRGRSPIKEIQDDVLQFGKKTEQAPIEFSEEQLAQPERKTKTPSKTPAALKIMPADTPHMRALKIKRYNLMKGIEETQSKVEKETKKTHQLKTDLEKSLAQKIRSGPNRPVESAFGSLMQEGSSSRTARQAKNRPEKNLDLFQKRLRKKLPASDDVPRKGIQEKVRGTQVTTWRKALDDRLWARRVNEQKMRQMVDDEKVLQQEEKENSRDALVLKRKKEAIEKHNSRRDLNERIRRVVRMEYRRQDVESEVEKYQKNRDYQEEAMVKKLLDEYVKTQRDMIIEERRLEKDEKKAQQERIKIMEDSQKHFFKDQIDMLKEEYVEAKREEEIVVKAQAEELRKIVREQKEAAKKKIALIKEKMAVDAGNLAFQEATAEELRSTLKFAFK